MIVFCKKCGNSFTPKTNNVLHCSRKCANARVHTKKTKAKIATSLKQHFLRSPRPKKENKKAIYTRSKIYTIDDNDFRSLVGERKSFTSINKFFGFKSGNAGAIKKRIASLNIDTSHFEISNRGKTFFELSKKQVKDKSQRLKKKLVSENLLKWECAECGNMGVHNGKPLTLQLDHIDGNAMNHLLENLRFLCPNCHSQTETFAGRNKSKPKSDH